MLLILECCCYFTNMDNMTENENVLTEKIICQEWVVMFDGEIKQNQEEVDYEKMFFSEDQSE